jgi:hypothetical protein
MPIARVPQRALSFGVGPEQRVGFLDVRPVREHEMLWRSASFGLTDRAMPIVHTDTRYSWFPSMHRSR